MSPCPAMHQRRRSCAPNALMLLAPCVLAALLGLAADPSAGPPGPRADRWRERLTLDCPQLDGRSRPVLAFTRDGQALLVGHWIGAVGMFDALNGRALKSLLQPDQILAVHALPDGRTLLVAGARDVRRVDATTGATRHEARWRPLAGARIALAGTGSAAAVVGSAGQVELWQLGDSAKAIPVPQAEAVLAVALSADGKRLATGGVSGTVKVWDVAPLREVRSFRAKGGAVRALTFLADGRALAFANGSRGVEIRTLTTGKEPPRLRGSLITFLSLAASPDGRVLAGGTANGGVRVWDLATGEVLNTFKAHAGQVQSLAFAADSKAFASAGNDETVKVWRPVGPLAEAPPEPPVSPRALDEKVAALGGSDGAQALQAVRDLVGTPRQTLARFKKILHPVQPIEPGRFARLLADLDSRRFAVREKARKELEREGDRARTALKTALAGGLTLEARRRVLGLLEQLDKLEMPEATWQRRAVEVLEKIGAREARDFLVVLTTGVPDAYLTRCARDALERLNE